MEKFKKGSLRKAALVRAAIECIAYQGVDKTTFDAIGAKLHMHRAHVAYHFPNKNDLIKAAIQHITTTAQTMTESYINKANTPQDKIKAITHAAFDWAKLNPDQASVLLVFYYFCSYEPDYRRLHTDIRNAGASRIYEILKSLFEKRAFSHKKAWQLSKNIQNLITGYLLEQIATNTGVGFNKAKVDLNKNLMQLIQAA